MAPQGKLQILILPNPNGFIAWVTTVGFLYAYGFHLETLFQANRGARAGASPELIVEKVYRTRLMINPNSFAAKT